MMKLKPVEGKKLVKKPIEKRSPVTPENNTNNKGSISRDPSPKKQYLPKPTRKSSSGENKTKRLQSISEIQEVQDSIGDKSTKPQTKLYRLKLNSDSLTSLKKVRINKSCEDVNKSYPFPRKVSNILNEIKKKKQVSELSLAKRNIVTREPVPLELGVTKNNPSENSKFESDTSGLYGWSTRKLRAKEAGTEKSQSYDCIEKIIKKKIANKCPSAEGEKLKNNFVESQTSTFYDNFSKNEKHIVTVDGNVVKIRKKTKDGQQRQINYALYSFDTPDHENSKKKFLNDWESSAAKKKNLEICYCPHIHTESYVRKICLQTSTSPTSKFNPQKFKLNYFTSPQNEEEENATKPTLNKKLSLSKINLPKDNRNSKYGQKTKPKKSMFEKRNSKNSKTKVTMKLTPGIKKPEKKEKTKKIDFNIKDSLDKISLWRNDNKMRILGKQKKGGMESKMREKKLSMTKKNLFDGSLISQKKKDELEILEKLYLKLDSVEKLLKKKGDAHYGPKKDHKTGFSDLKKTPEPKSEPKQTFFYGNVKDAKKRKLRHAVLDRALQWFDSSPDENL